MAKKKPARKPTVAEEEKREICTSALLMVETARKIKAQDCAAYSMLVFNRGDSPDEWQKLGVEAFSKFAEFGWAMFHSIGGLSVDWDKAGDNIIAKLKQLPKRTP